MVKIDDGGDDRFMRIGKWPYVTSKFKENTWYTWFTQISYSEGDQSVENMWQ